MTKTFCDRCKNEIPAPAKAQHVSLITYEGAQTKEICPSCFEMWREQFLRFFQPQ